MDKRSPSAAMSHQEMMDLFDAIDTAQKNRCLSAAGLAIGSSSKAKVLIANTVTFLNGGVFKSKTTAEVAFTATTDDIAANADKIQEAKYLVCLASDGTPSLVKGATADENASVLPAIPSGKTPIGYVKIAIAAGATKFDASSDELDAAHITDTYVDLGWIAPRFDAIQ